MKYLRPVPYDTFVCAGPMCKAPCPAPVDMTWTRTLGDLCESGLSLGCPRAAELLLRTEKLTFREDSDNVPPMESPVPPERIALLLDARKTVDLLLQDRGMPMRSRAELALTYCAELEPLIDEKNRYRYEEMDWGFTEQPGRQLQSIQQLSGDYDRKRRTLSGILEDLTALSGGDAILLNHLSQTRLLMRTLDGEQYQLLRDAFDRFLEPHEYWFENLMVCEVHRFFLSHTGAGTVAPGAKRMAVTFAVIRAMAVRIWQETGDLSADAFTALCRHYTRLTEEDPGAREEMTRHFREDPRYSWEALQQMLYR